MPLLGSSAKSKTVSKITNTSLNQQLDDSSAVNVIGNKGAVTLTDQGAVAASFAFAKELSSASLTRVDESIAAVSQAYARVGELTQPPDQRLAESTSGSMKLLVYAVLGIAAIAGLVFAARK